MKKSFIKDVVLLLAGGIGTLATFDTINHFCF